MFPSLDDTNQWRLDPQAGPRSDLGLFRTANYSDAKIECDGHTWDLHKSVMCPRSTLIHDVFHGIANDANDAMLSSVRGRSSHLRDDGVMVIDGFSKDEVELALVYLYGNIYPAALKQDATVWECYRVFEVAEYLDIGGLQAVAVRALAKSLERLEESLCEALTFKALQHKRGGPGGDLDGDISEELREALPEQAIAELRKIHQTAFQEQEFESLQQPMRDFIEATIFVFFGPGDTLDAVESVLAEDSALWFDLVEAMTQGQSASQAADAVGLSQGLRRQSSPATSATME
ncbi:hypothetical protein PG993_011914 [Apiospora rasikravindrae]|uniref:BTB domain-containing protein n=1 Tax=Apiospora rasikravindrae TaxID=990691 RepID=A0ABR1S142_9PEZI